MIGRAAKRDFSETRWSLILAATVNSDQSQQALGSLCEAYWYPLYAFARRQGLSAHDAEDATQAFFSHLLEKEVFTKADRSKGRFRTFLLASLKNFLADEHGRVHALKRGGGSPPVSLDGCAAEERYALEPADESSPDRLFDRRWALTVIDKALARLTDEYGQAGKEALFAGLKPLLTGTSPTRSYAELGAGLNMSEGATKVAVHRLRQRYGAALRSVIAETVAAPTEVDAELRYLLESLGG